MKILNEKSTWQDDAFEFIRCCPSGDKTLRYIYRLIFSEKRYTLSMTEEEATEMRKAFEAKNKFRIYYLLISSR